MHIDSGKIYMTKDAIEMEELQSSINQKRIRAGRKPLSIGQLKGLKDYGIEMTHKAICKAEDSRAPAISPALSVSDAFRTKMDVALSSADRSKGSGADGRRTDLMQDLDRAGLIIMEKEIVALLMEKASALKDSPALYLFPDEKPIVSEAEKLELLQEACLRIIPYLDWTIGPESSSHHPTMPSAVFDFKHSVETSGVETSPKGLVARIRKRAKEKVRYEVNFEPVSADHECAIKENAK